MVNGWEPLKPTLARDCARGELKFSNVGELVLVDLQWTLDNSNQQIHIASIHPNRQLKP